MLVKRHCREGALRAARGVRKESVRRGLLSEGARRHIGIMEYHKCLACRKGWANEAPGVRRILDPALSIA